MERKARRLLWEYGVGETPQEQSDEEAPQTAHGKRSAWSGNQQPSLTVPIKKETKLSLFCFL
ncbi:hypothetical protein E2K98_10320 [Bacillus salipaludis]|uniref:Uncharacterized protein n=1 Tax=Bacillus salipaludis TaxID=2547811 RepID=A0A4R5VTW5_9BACI|nr:hypothetical protein E2K98_10320 [Bacillus salipaludis]